MSTLVELCAGTASVSLWALARIGPLTGFMGSKRRYASALVDALGVDRPDRVVLVDAGPWGDVWTVLRSARARAHVADILDAWQGIDPSTLWATLATTGGDLDASARVARYLWLQARSASTVPVWWDDASRSWQSPTGSRTEIAHETRTPRKIGGATQMALRQKSTPNGCRGLIHPRSLARRVRALDALPWDRLTVVHGLVEDVEPVPGAVVYYDPPYRYSPRYAVLTSRRTVLDVAERWGRVARVAVSEAEPLPLPAWTSRRLAAREWVTANWEIALPEQLGLFAEVA